MTHELKTWPEYFKAVKAGAKTFEVRHNDRNFNVNDELILWDYCPKKKEYSGDSLRMKITYVLTGGQFGIDEGTVILGIQRVDTAHSNIEQEIIDGYRPIFKCKMNADCFGLTEKEAMSQDLAEEYAICADKMANAGLIVYAKYNGVWQPNPYSTRFLVRFLLEQLGVNIQSNKK